MQIEVNLRDWGSAPKYGAGARKLGREEAELLGQRGWKVVSANPSGYSYAIPPANYAHKGRTIPVAIDVPTLDEVTALADRLHASRSRYMGRLAGWPVNYSPPGVCVMQTMDMDGNRGMRETQTRAWFRIGHGLIWSVYIFWDVDDAPPRVCETRGHSE